MTLEHKISIEHSSDTEVIKKNELNKLFYLRYVTHIAMLSENIFVNCFGLFTVMENRWNDNYLIRQGCDYAPAYVTNWNMAFQSIFLTMSVCYDTLQWIDKHETSIGRRLRFWRDVIFSGLVVPLTLFVTGMFWVLFWIDRELVFPKVYDQIVPWWFNHCVHTVILVVFVTGMFWVLFWIDRELVFPKVYDQIVPWWFNHCVHTVILVVVVLETLLQPRQRPADETVETRLVVGCTVLYAIVYYSVYLFGHRWLYPVFGIMKWWQLCIFQTFIWCISYGFYRVQFPINRLVHGSNEGITKEPDLQIDGNVESDFQNDISVLGNDNSALGNDNYALENDTYDNVTVRNGDVMCTVTDQQSKISRDNDIKKVKFELKNDIFYVNDSDGIDNQIYHKNCNVISKSCS